MLNSLRVLSLCFLFNIAFAQEKDLNYYYDKSPFKMPLVVVPKFTEKQFNIKDYGALSDNITICTEAFVKAIAACTNAGGGKVIVPVGTWITGPIEMKNNVNLVVEKGALIQFTDDHTKFPINNKGFVASPINGFGLTNIAITGEGIIDGAGDSWRPVKKDKTTELQWQQLLQKGGGVVSANGKVWWPSQAALDGEDYLKKLKSKGGQPTEEDYIPARDFQRPYMVMFSKCTNILIEGVTIRNSPKFIFYPTSCRNLTVRNANFYNDWWAQNGDALDISACKNVVIYKCTVNAGDDGICMKSSAGKGGSDSTEANLENILIAGCTVFRGHGGFVIGSNTDGGMKNIFVTDCNFIGTDIGIRVKSNSGRGGLVHDIYISNIEMKNIMNEAILFSTDYEDVVVGKNKGDIATSAKDKVPEFKNFYISNINCEGAKTAILMNGLPEKWINNIYFSNVKINSDKGFEGSYATDIDFKNVQLKVKRGSAYNKGNCKNINVHDE